MNITEEDAEKAHSYLMHTADEFSEVAANVNFLKEKVKIVEAIEFDKIDKGGETTKRMQAKASQPYSDIIGELKTVEARYIYLKVMREAAASKISLFQTLVKAKGQGIII